MSKSSKSVSSALPSVHLGKRTPMTPAVQAVLVQNLQATLDALTAEGVANANRRRAVKAELAKAMRGEW